MKSTLDKQTSGNWIVALKRFSPILLMAGLLTGCATAKVKPAYPALDAGTPASVLKIDNTMADSVWSGFSSVPIGMNVTIDGFLPLEASKLKYTWQILPTGTTEVRLPVGSHVLVHNAIIMQNKIYYFNPVSMSFDTEAGKTYVIHFKNTSTALKLHYAVEYKGWSTEQASQWPNEVSAANPMFGH